MKKVLILGAVLAIAAGVAAVVFLPLKAPAEEAASKEVKLPRDFGAYVLNVADGRTMAISVSNDLYTLRVKGIDLPTRSDALLESELNLRTLVFGRNILVENATKAADGVYEGDVRVGPDHVAEAQVGAGLATPNGQNNELSTLQETAKLSKLGMWAPEEPAEAPPAEQSSVAVAH